MIEKIRHLIRTDEIADSAITDLKIADSAVTNAKVVDGSLLYTKLAADTIVFKIPVLIPDSVQSGLAADSTGVKWTSAFKFRIPKTHVKDIVLRATWTASTTDSVTEISLIDETTGYTVCSVSGNSGTDVESTNYNEANLTDDGLVVVQASITTASATAGATFDIAYVVVELRIGIS